MKEPLNAKLTRWMRSTIFVYSISVLLSFPLAVAVVALVTPAVVPLQAETAAIGVKQFINRSGREHDLNSLEITRLLERYNLSWLYITDGSAKPSAESARFAPYLSDYPMRSGYIKLRETNYYEAVSSLQSGYLIHVGIDATFPGLPLSAPEDLLFFWNMPFRGGSMIAIFLISAVLNFLVLARIFLEPLAKFSREIKNLAESPAPSTVAFDKIQLSPMASSELWNLKGALHDFIAALSEKEKEAREALQKQGSEAGPWLKPSEKELQEVSNQSLPKVKSTGHKATVHALKALKQSEEAFGENITEGVIERFPGLVTGVVFMKGEVLAGKATTESIVKSAGLKEGQLLELAALNLQPLFEQARTAGKAINLGPMSMKRTGLDSVMVRLNAQHIVMAPIRHRRRYLGFLLVLTKEALGPDQIRGLERLLDQTAGLYNSLLQREEKEEQIWSDPLTELRNKAYLQESVSDLNNSMGITSGQTYAIVYFSLNSESGSCDNNLDNYALSVAKAMKHLKETKHLAKLGDLSKLDLARAQPLEFAIIIRGENETFYEQCCLELGRLLETGLRAERTVAHNLVISLGLAVFPFDAMKGDDVLARAKLAMVLAENLAKPENNPIPQNGYRVTLSLAKARNVPDNFKPLRKYTAVKGELGVMDGAEVIQSMASGGRTGVLTVEDPVTNRQFTLLVEDGKAIGAELGKMQGMDALMEFVSTFETGTFVFSEKPSLDKEALQIKRMPMPSIMNCLMDSALATDNLTAARQIIKDLRTPIIAQYSDAAWQELFRHEEPGQREQHLLKEIMRMADGRFGLEAIFGALSYAPTAMVWHAAARLTSHGLIGYAVRR